MIPLDFTTTAMPRPEIVARTYASFRKHLRGVDWKASTLYLNVDPLPDCEGPRLEVVAVARGVFGDVVVRLPTKADYGLACKWIWAQPTGETFFNLEDDFELTEGVDIDKLQGLLAKQMLAVSLRVYAVRYRSVPTSPSLYRRKHFSGFAPKMVAGVNPEKQLQIPLKQAYLWHRAPHPSQRVYVYPPKVKHIIVRDIGREWSEDTGYMRPQALPEDDSRQAPKMDFVRWVRR